MLMLLGYALLGFWGIPLLVGWIVPAQVREHLDREATMGKVRFNPFTFVFELRDLEIKDPDGSPLLTWDRFRLDFEFTSVFHGPWHVRELLLDAPSFRARINPDYRFNFSDLIDKYGTTADEPAQTNSPSEPLPALVIDSITVTNLAASYADLTTSQPFSVEASPINLLVRDFRTATGHTNRFSLQGSTDIGMQFQVEGETLLAPPEVTSRIGVTELTLNSLEAFYSDYLELKVRDGKVDLATEVHLKFGDEEQIAQVHNTLLSLRNLRVGLPDNATNLVELDQLTVQAPFADAWKRDAQVGSIALDGVRLNIHRRADHSLELVEAAHPKQTDTQVPATVALTFNAVSNIASLFSGNTNVGLARLDHLVLTNSSVALLDEAPGIPVQVMLSGLSAEAEHFSTAADATPTAHVAFDWQTNGTFQLMANARITPPSLELEVDLKDWDLSVADAYLSQFANVQLEQSILNFNGRASLQVPQDTEPEGRFKGRLGIHQFKTSHGSDSANLLHWDDFTVEGIEVGLQPLAINIDTISLAAPEVWGVIQTNGTVNLLTAANLTNAVITTKTTTLTSDSPEEVQAKAEQVTGATSEPSQAALPPVRIGGILVTNAILYLSDKFSQPDAHLTVNPLNLWITHLDSADMQSMDISGSGSLEPAGTFILTAIVRPLDCTNATTLKLTTEGIDLSPTEPYVQRFLGYELDRGTLTTDLDYRISNRQLNGQNLVTLNQLTLGEAVESPDAIKAPIKLGIKVLQDRQGRIQLEVPVAGSLDDPQFDIGKVISGAFANIFTKVLTSPFSVLGGLLGEGESDDLERVAFAAGSAEIDKAGMKRLGKLEKVLYERPTLGLDLLALVDPAADRAVLRELRLNEQLFELRTSGGQTNAVLSTDEEATLVADAYRRLHGLDIPEAEPLPTALPAVPEPTVAEPETPAPRTRIRLSQNLRGGERMMQRRLSSSTSSGIPPTENTEPLVEMPPSQEPAQLIPEPAHPELPPVPVMRQSLLEAITVPDDALAELGRQRIDAVRKALLQGGTIEPDRISLKTLSGPAPSGVEVRFSLQ